MAPDGPLTVLCIATYEKGGEFLLECKRQGCRVLLLTDETLRGAAWPREAIDETFYVTRDLPREALLKGVAHVARTERLDRIVPLDDFDVETAALLREHLRVAGMGETTARYFRDKLAMRVRAREAGLPEPDFVPAIHDADVRAYAGRVSPPWVVKPRWQASAIGIRIAHDVDALWAALDALGDERSFSLVEQFVAGDVYHVDAIVWEREVVFSAVHKYGQPPWQVAHQGGVFRTRTIRHETPETAALEAINRDVLASFGLVRGVAHTEFIRSPHDGAIYFLETSARVGGAHIVETIEAATGVNLWREWARLEVAGGERPYTPTAAARDAYAGIALSLARQERPDTSAYTDAEIVFRVDKPFHAGLIVQSTDPARIESLLDEYARRFMVDFFATAPAPDRPTS